METRENMQKNAQLMGVLWIVYGVLSILGGIAVLVVLLVVSHIPEVHFECAEIGPQILQIIGISVGSFLFALGVVKIIAGIGLQKYREWARVMTMVLSFLSLLNVPMGTALGIYSIVYLMKPEMTELFKPKTA